MAGNPFSQFPQPARFMAESRTADFGMSIPGVNDSDAKKMIKLGGAFAYFDRMSQDPEYMAQVKALKEPPIPSVEAARVLEQAGPTVEKAKLTSGGSKWDGIAQTAPKGPIGA